VISHEDDAMTTEPLESTDGLDESLASRRRRQPVPNPPDDSVFWDDADEFIQHFARAGRRTMREKLAAGLRGFKYAFRGDSSFFAHAYRGLLIALTAALLGVGPMGWCLLVITAGLVLVAELSHSAVDTLARSIGDPDEPALKVAREIASAGVIAAVIVMAAVSICVLTLKLGELLSWW
jgi:diacylglycerol kinase (ATP)